MNRQGEPAIFEPDYYQRLYDTEERHWWSRGMRKAMRGLLNERLAERRNLRVLDVGCGTGYTLFSLAKHYCLDPHVVGSDLSQHALEFCRRRGISCLVRANAERLPFVAESFDLILCIDTLQHLSSEAAMSTLEGIAHLLAPGGLLFLRTNSVWGHRKLTGVDPDRYRRYPPRQVVSLLEQAGLSVERATHLNALPSLWGALKEFLGPPRSAPALGPGLSIRLYPSQLAWLNELLYWLLCLEALWLEHSGLDLRFGHSTGFVARCPVERSSRGA
ncbi:MAG: class I SAM-dependent methyltransferase [Acidobacteriota bacterium]